MIGIGEVGSAKGEAEVLRNFTTGDCELWISTGGDGVLWIVMRGDGVLRTFTAGDGDAESS